VQVAGAFAAYGLGRILSEPGVEHLGRDLVRAQVLTQTLTFALKFAVARERPDGSDNRSFPSGHASGTFATATVLQRRYGWQAGIPAYAVAGYVGCSRLNEGRHYLSDVVFGAALGITAGRTVTIDLARVRFTVSPVPTSDGLQIQLRRL
jgi:membrane-associated phospholipid phosphatase